MPLRNNASAEDAMQSLWDGLKRTSQLLGVPIPGEGQFVQVDCDVYDQMVRIEQTVRCCKIGRGVDDMMVSLSAFQNALDRLDQLRRGLGAD